MIYDFDGFNWNSGNSTTLTGHLSNLDLNVLNIHASSGSGFLLHEFIRGGNYVTMIKLVSKEKFSLGSKLVVGERIKFSGSAGTLFLQSLIPEAQAYSSTYIPNKSGEMGEEFTDQVPCLQYLRQGGTSPVTSQTSTGLRLLSRRRATPSASDIEADTLAYFPLTGVNPNVENFFETVYDVANNKIEIWANDIKVGEVDYIFTQAQKDSDQFIGFISAGASDGSTGNQPWVFLYNYYVADERLGPVKVIDLPPTQESEISSGMQTSAPTNLSDILTYPSAVSSTETGRAYYSGAVLENEEPLAVSISSRFTQRFQSAYENDGFFRMSLRLSGSYYDQDERQLTANEIDTAYKVLGLNPDTGLPWTLTDIQQLEFGFQIRAEPLNPGA